MNSFVTREALEALSPQPMADEREALGRLLELANGDSGQARRVASFLLAWWNAGSCGGFDPTDTWGLDTALAEDVVKVFGMVVRCRSYPPSLDPALAEPFQRLVREWRPGLFHAEAEDVSAEPSSMQP